MDTGFDTRAFRNACGQFMTGVTIVTTRDEVGNPVGLTANSFTSVSLDPPMVLVSLDKKIASYPAFLAANAYAVHVLSADQQELSARFATKGADKFGGLAWMANTEGVPILPEYLALFECTVAHVYEGGDHSIFVGRVHRFDVRDAAAPLGFLRGRYCVPAVGA